MRAEKRLAWVVYQTTPHGQAVPLNAVCEQGEWDEMGTGQSGERTLVLGGITNEAEAERMARGTSGDPKPRLTRG
jgi:hypothetical protein